MNKADNQAKAAILPASTRGVTRLGKRNEPVPVLDSPKPQTVRYTTHLTPETVKAIKVYALEHDMKNYRVVQQAVNSFVRKGKPEK